MRGKPESFQTINSHQINQAHNAQGFSNNLQHKILKNQKHYVSSQTTGSSINVPRGTNQPKRSFNREGGEQPGNKFQIHPILNVNSGHSTAQGFNKLGSASTSMMIMEHQDTSDKEQDKYKVVNYDYNSSVSTTFQIRDCQNLRRQI